MKKKTVKEKIIQMLEDKFPPDEFYLAFAWVQGIFDAWEENHDLIAKVLYFSTYLNTSGTVDEQLERGLKFSANSKLNLLTDILSSNSQAGPYKLSVCNLEYLRIGPDIVEASYFLKSEIMPGWHPTNVREAKDHNDRFKVSVESPGEKSAIVFEGKFIQDLVAILEEQN